MCLLVAGAVLFQQAEVTKVIEAIGLGTVASK